MSSTNKKTNTEVIKKVMKGIIEINNRNFVSFFSFASFLKVISFICLKLCQGKIIKVNITIVNTRLKNLKRVFIS
jgi:hypothetical protein